jgi:hypothetical protein
LWRLFTSAVPVVAVVFACRANVAEFGTRDRSKVLEHWCGRCQWCTRHRYGPEQPARIPVRPGACDVRGDGPRQHLHVEDLSHSGARSSKVSFRRRGLPVSLLRPGSLQSCPQADSFLYDRHPQPVNGYGQTSCPAVLPGWTSPLLRDVWRGLAGSASNRPVRPSCTGENIDAATPQTPGRRTGEGTVLSTVQQTESFAGGRYARGIG